jgi:hypothetical protein
VRWAGHIAYMEEKENAYRVLVWEWEGKRPLGRPRHRYEDNIKMDVREVQVGCGGIDWICFARDRDQLHALVKTVMNLGGSKKCWIILEYLSSWWLLKKDSSAWSWFIRVLKFSTWKDLQEMCNFH